MRMSVLVVLVFTIQIVVICTILRASVHTIWHSMFGCGTLFFICSCPQRAGIVPNNKTSHQSIMENLEVHCLKWERRHRV